MTAGGGDAGIPAWQDPPSGVCAVLGLGLPWSSSPVPKKQPSPQWPWLEVQEPLTGCASCCLLTLRSSFLLGSLKEGMDRTVMGILVSYQIKVKLTVSG